MKRLRTRAFETQTEMTDHLIPLEELDAADVRHDRCPNCRHDGLEREDGFKKCPVCNSVYKLFDGEGFIVANIGR